MCAINTAWKIGIWPCPNCRDFAKDIKRLDKNLLELSKTVSDLLEVIESSEIRQTSLESELTTLKELDTALLDQNDRLAREIRALKADFMPESIPTDITPSAERSLIIGSSMIRNFDESKMSDVPVCCMPGASMCDIEQKLWKYFQESICFKSIKIGTGGNDASLPVDEVDLDATTAAFRSVITAAKAIAPDVTIAAIPLRSQPAYTLDNIHIFYGTYKVVADEMSVRFAPNDEHFYFKMCLSMKDICMIRFTLRWKGRTSLQNPLVCQILLMVKTRVCSYRPSQAHCYDHKS